MSQLDTQEGGGVGRDGTGQGRTEAGEEGLEAAAAVELADDTTKSDVALGGLEARLDGVDGEDGNPHGNTGSTTGGDDGADAEVAGGLAGDGVLGAEGALDVLVGGKVGGGAGAVAGEGGDAAAEDGADAALLVELADDVEAAVVFGLLAGAEGLLALDLEDDLDALKGGGDGGHGDGGEETGGGDLADGEAVWADLGDAADYLLADTVAPEGDGDCGRGGLVWGAARKRVHGKLTHGSDADEGRADTGVETSAQTIAGNALLDDVNGGRVDAALGGLQADLDEVKRVADDDGADTTDGAGAGVAQLVEEARGGLGLDLLGVGQLLDDGLCGGGGGAGGGHCGGKDVAGCEAAGVY